MREMATENYMSETLVELKNKLEQNTTYIEIP